MFFWLSISMYNWSRYWFCCWLSLITSLSWKVLLNNSHALLNIFLAVYASAWSNHTHLNIKGNMNKNVTVKNIHIIIYLILFQAFFILSSFHCENMKKNIARMNAYIHHAHITMTTKANIIKIAFCIVLSDAVTFIL